MTKQIKTNTIWARAAAMSANKTPAQLQAECDRRMALVARRVDAKAGIWLDGSVA